MGDLATTCTFKLTDQNDDPVDAANFTYETDVNASVVNIYDAVRTVYWLLRLPIDGKT